MPDGQKGEAKWKVLVAKIDSTKFALAHPELWKFVKAMAAGSCGALPELIVYMLMCALFTRLAVSYLPDFFFFNLIRANMDASQYEPAAEVYAFLISTAVGHIIGYILERNVAFHANINVALSTFFKVIVVVVTIALNGIIGPGIVALVARIPFLRPNMVRGVSKVLSMMVSTAWVYPSDRFLVHMQVKNKKEAPDAA